MCNTRIAGVSRMVCLKRKDGANQATLQQYLPRIRIGFLVGLPPTCLGSEERSSNEVIYFPSFIGPMALVDR